MSELEAFIRRSLHIDKLEAIIRRSLTEDEYGAIIRRSLTEDEYGAIIRRLLTRRRLEAIIRRSVTVTEDEYGAIFGRSLARRLARRRLEAIIRRSVTEDECEAIIRRSLPRDKYEVIMGLALTEYEAIIRPLLTLTKDKYERIIRHSCQGTLFVSSSRQSIDKVFDRLRRQVNRLFTNPDWLPIQRSQISFYSQQVSYLHSTLRFLKCSCHEYYALELLSDPTLNILVGRILDCNQPPDFNLVGDRLAFEVAVVYEPCKQDFGRSSQHFASLFHFDDEKFQEHYEREVFVGFEVVANSLLKQLASISKKKLEIISIVGMAGLGKTTLAQRLYNDPYLVSYFYVRAWVTCSRVYQKRNLLLAILRSVSEVTDDVCRMHDSVLVQSLYRALKGRRYLIVIDDIWSSKAWDDFKSCFPDDNNGSKIMLTTRLKDVALHTQPDRDPFCLRFLTEEESFNLLRMKAFVTGNVLDHLSLIGRNITRKCRGLPLAIVVIAGLLKNNTEMDWWKQIEKSVSSYSVIDANQYIDALALSYNHLPQHLRPCFLSFGAFRENDDIPVRRLIRSWIAEGFILRDRTEKSLEHVAEDFLMDLVRRSLVVVGKKGSNGKIKTCRIHNLLHDVCLRKAKEENFPLDVYKYSKHSHLCPNKGLVIPSECSCYSSEISQSFFMDVSIHWDSSKLIRTLDISSIELFVFPCELLQLVQLRYLEIRFTVGSPPESVSQLRELQTLIMSSKMNMVIPKNMWKMINLRHLCIKSGDNLVNFSNVEEEPSFLENLQTMSLVSPSSPCQQILAKTRNLKKLGLCGPLATENGDLKCPNLGILMHLETLKLLNTVPLRKAGRLSDSCTFPENLKSLSIANTYLEWKEDWIFEKMPNLEVLKLKLHAFSGSDWETRSKTFPRLKFLKLDELDIMTWTATRNHFPVLRHLQVYRCSYLMEIPEDFGNICTLEVIELDECSDSAANSARDLQKEQESYGNDCLKIFLKAGSTPSQTDAQKGGMLHTLRRYNERVESTMPEEEHEAQEEEVQDEECQKVQIEDLKSEYIKILGNALGGLDLEELQQLELLMNEGLLSVKGKKEQLLKEQLDQLREKEKEVMLENKNLRQEFEELCSFFPTNALPVSRYLNHQKPEDVASSQASSCKSEADDGDSMTTLLLWPPENSRRKRKTQARKIFKSESPPGTSGSGTEN